MMRRSGCTQIAILLALVFLVLTPRTASAQRKSWGLSVGFIPSWKTVSPSKSLFSADRTELSGSEFRVGIVRGRTKGGDWGISYVRKSLDAGGVVVAGANSYQLGSGVNMNGALLHAAPALGHITEHVQIGLVFSAGVAQVTGSATRNGLAVVDAKQALTPFGYETSVQPLGGLELSVAAIATKGFKIRATGGVTWPGIFKIGIGGVYLFER